MTFEELMEVNKGLKATNIKGKDYVDVANRVLGFRKLFPEGQIITKRLESEPGTAEFYAEIRTSDGRILGTGHAREEKNASAINRVSYVECAETSAIGRALGFGGIGSQSSIASAEEMVGALEAQEVIKQTDKLIDTIIEMAGGDRERVDAYVRNVFPGNRLDDLDYQTLVRVKTAIAKQITAQPKQTEIPTYNITRREK